MVHTLASHAVVDSRPGHVIIKRLELFCGFDPDTDPPGSPTEKYDATLVRKVVESTQKFIAKRQHPRLILGHNAVENLNTGKPAIGNVVAVYYEDRDGVGFILGDVEMSREDFDTYIASNRYPRRSAEIWSKQLKLSEVALLGSETPARPLPDTQFNQSDEPGDREVFSQAAEHVVFSGFTGVGPSSMPPKGNEDMDDLEKSKKAFSDLEAERDELKKKLKKYQEDEKKKDEAEKNSAAEKEKFAAEIQALTERADAAEKAAATERYTRLIDQAEREGFSFGDNRDAVLDRIVCSADPDEELKFMKSIATRVPANVVIDQEQFSQPVPEEGDESMADRVARMEAAVAAATKPGVENRRDAFSAALATEGGA